MINLLERVTNAIRNAPKERFVNSQTLDTTTGIIVAENVIYRITPESQAQAAIAAICDEIDEGAVREIYDNILRKCQCKECFGKAIKAYLAHIKSTTETKGAV